MSESEDYELIINDERGEELCRVDLDREMWGMLIQVGLMEILRSAVRESPPVD